MHLHPGHSTKRLGGSRQFPEKWFSPTVVQLVHTFHSYDSNNSGKLHPRVLPLSPYAAASSSSLAARNTWGGGGYRRAIGHSTLSITDQPDSRPNFLQTTKRQIWHFLISAGRAVAAVHPERAREPSNAAAGRIYPPLFASSIGNFALYSIFCYNVELVRFYPTLISRSRRKNFPPVGAIA